MFMQYINNIGIRTSFTKKNANDGVSLRINCHRVTIPRRSGDDFILNVTQSC